MHISLHVNTRYSSLFLLDFNKPWNFLDKFSKNTQISNFMKDRPLAAELFYADGRTDEQRDMTKLIVAFRNFENVPKNRMLLWKWKYRIATKLYASRITSFDDTKPLLTPNPSFCQYSASVDPPTLAVLYYRQTQTVEVLSPFLSLSRVSLPLNLPFRSCATAVYKLRPVCRDSYQNCALH